MILNKVAIVLFVIFVIGADMITPFTRWLRLSLWRLALWQAPLIEQLSFQNPGWPLRESLTGSSLLPWSIVDSHCETFRLHSYVCRCHSLCRLY